MVPGLAFALVAVALWSTNAVAAKVVLAEASVTQVLALQFSGAAATLLVMHLALGPGRKAPDLRNPRLVALGFIGIVGTISFQYLAFRYSPIVEANIIAYGWPLYAAIWWAAMRRSIDGIWFVACALVGFAGVVLIIANGRAFSYSSAFLAGYLFALASSFCMAFYTLAAARTRNPGPAAILPAILAGSAVTLAMAFSGDAPWPSFSYLLVGAYIGIGPMALGYYLWMRAASVGNPASLAQIGFLTPLLSTLWLLLAGETMGRMAFVGGVCVIGGSIAAVLLERASRQRQAGSARPQGLRHSRS